MSTLGGYAVCGAGPDTVLLLHGVGGDGSSWNRQKAAIVGAGWRHVALDCPGYGGTPLPKRLGWAEMRQAALAALDALGVERAVLLGHSMGGMLAQEIAAHAPDRVRALILSATSPAFGKPDGDWQRDFLAARLKPFDDGLSMPAFAEAFVPQMVGSAADGAGVAEAARCMANVPVATYRAALETLVTFEGRPHLAKIAVPTLLIAGEEDDNAPLPVMQKMASKIARATLATLPGIGHLANFEATGAFNDAVLSFLNTLRGDT
ncbi:MAG: alpha/beta hydrolase [Pseudomonadota bacterium]